MSLKLYLYILHTQFRPVGGTVHIKQLIVVPDRVLCTRYFVLQKYRTQFVYDYTRTVPQLTGLTGQNMEVLNQPYSGQLAYSLRFMCVQSAVRDAHKYFAKYIADLLFEPRMFQCIKTRINYLLYLQIHSLIFTWCSG